MQIFHLPCVHNGVFMIAAIQIDSAREYLQTCQQQKQHLETLFAAINEISVENVLNR